MAEVKATFYLRVYNVEAELLRRAVESVLDQTEREFRFIIQDNGSTDGSKEILESYARKDARITLYRNETNGYETPEETAVRESVFREEFVECGSKYFAIIDSDDAYEPTFLERAIAEAEGENADIVFAAYRQMRPDGTVLAEKIPYALNEEENVNNFLIEGYPFLRTLWGNLYARKLWDSYWRFLNVDRPDYMRNGLDTYVNLSLLKECENIAFMDSCMYIQTIRPNSVYKTDIRPERLQEADLLFLKGIETAQSYGVLNEETISFLASVYYYHLVDVIHGIVKEARPEKIEHVVTLMNDSDVFGMLAEKNHDLRDLKGMLT